MTCPNVHTKVKTKYFQLKNSSGAPVEEEKPFANTEEYLKANILNKNNRYVAYGEYTPLVKCSGTIEYIPVDMDDICCPEPGDDYHYFNCPECAKFLGEDTCSVTIDFTKYPQLNIGPVRIITEALKEIA